MKYYIYNNKYKVSIFIKLIENYNYKIYNIKYNS